MIFHFSIDAEQPERVARVLAGLWACEAYPFAPVGRGSWIVISEDDKASAIEIYQRGVTLYPGEGADPVRERMIPSPSNVAMHFAIATALSEADVCALGAREGWRTVRQSRGGRFHVIEMWIENRIMIEVLTAEMQAEYLATSTAAQWREMLAAQKAA